MATVELSASESSGLKTSPLAQRCSVRQRRRGDLMSISSARDFRYGPAETVDALTALTDPNVTLYCLDTRRRQAIFVECDEKAALEESPFYYQGQFQHARRAIVISLDDMHEAANHVGDRFERAVMIHSVGRCGSTLLSKMFARSSCCLSLSEPDVYTQVAAEPLSTSSAESLLRSANRLYFQPPANHHPTHLVLKFRSFCIELAQQLEKATPSSRSLFLYRDVQRVVRSGMRVFCYAGAPLWWVSRLHRWVVTRPILAGAFWANRDVGARLFPVLSRFTDWEMSRMGPVGVLAAAWVASMERSVQLVNAGMNLPAIRYDDLVAHPAQMTANLVKYCQLPPASLHQMLEAMQGDSQSGTVIARRNQRDYELTQRDRDTIGMVLARSDIIDDGEFEIPGTWAASP